MLAEDSHVQIPDSIMVPLYHHQYYHYIPYIPIIYPMVLGHYHSHHIIWLVVSTPLKNISQIGSSSQLLGENKIHVPNHQPVMVSSYPYPATLW